MPRIQQGWPTFDVLYLFADVAQAHRGAPSNAAQIAPPSTQRALVRTANRTAVNEAQWHAIGDRICVLATVSVSDAWAASLLILRGKSAPSIVRPFYSNAFYSEMQNQVEISYIWLETYQLGVFARKPFAPYSVAFDASHSPSKVSWTRTTVWQQTRHFTMTAREGFCFSATV